MATFFEKIKKKRKLLAKKEKKKKKKEVNNYQINLIKLKINNNTTARIGYVSLLFKLFNT